MFGKDFFPTPEDVIDEMLNGDIIEGMDFLEPSAGKGNIVEWLKRNGAKNVIACEINEDLRQILQSKCTVIADDFLTLTSEQVSHIDHIVMNPPFSADEKHILHAWEIAPAGCQITALCNYSIINDHKSRWEWTTAQRQLQELISSYGRKERLGQVFQDAERQTDCVIGLVKLKKPGESGKNEFEGFFLDEEIEAQENGIMSYNAIRDIVNRYVGAVRVFDEQLEAAQKMQSLTSGFFSSAIAMHFTADQKPMKREEFKKDLQKNAWKYIFSLMNLEKYSTRGLKQDINRFVEKQTHIPFTMKNIYKMLEIVIGTTESRMDKAVLEVFEKITEHHHDNRHNVEGWKTNSHYLVGETFILPWLTRPSYNSGWQLTYHSENYEIVNDFMKALCFVLGINYEDYTKHGDFWQWVNIMDGKLQWGQWYSYGFFEIKAYKKGTMHFKFQNKDVWAKFNQRVAKLKGYPLFEHKEQTTYQEKQTGRYNQGKGNTRKAQDSIKQKEKAATVKKTISEEYQEYQQQEQANIFFM